MNSLIHPPVSTVLARLFAHAQETDAPFRRELQGLAPRERDALMATAKTDYAGFYAHARGMYLPVSERTGKLLYLLARSSHAKTVVEFGTSFGVSSIHLAAAIRDNGGGRLIGTELLASKAATARENIEAAGLSPFVDVREGDAKESLARDMPDSVDFVLLDGAKILYPDILALLEPRLRPGALIVADNAGDSPEYLERVRGGGGYVSVPFGDDVEVSTRT